MKSLLLGFTALLLPLIVSAKVIESNQYAEVLKYVDSQTLLITDLDNTVIRPIQEIGSDQWGGNIMDQLRKAGIQEPLATNLGVAAFASVQIKTKVKLVEADTAIILRQALARGAQLIGLTARPLYLSERTVEQLQSVGFPFPSQAQYSDLDGTKSVRGVVFAGNNKKGEVLKAYLKDAQFKNIRRVVFIDDKAHHAENVDKVLADSSYDVISIRYGAADEWVQSFDVEKADKEWQKYLSIGHL